MAGLSQRVEALAPDKRALLELLLAEKRKSAAPDQVIPRRPEGDAPLSFAQERLWFMAQLQPGNPFYNMPAAVRLTGSLNIAALQQSLKEIVRRHEALRTSFVSANGGARQVIVAADRDVQLLLIDLGELPTEEREREAERHIREATRQPFDLQHDPLLRTLLLRLDERTHMLALVMHHLIADGWSTGVLIRELAALYQAFDAGRPSPLADLPIQYADFAYWQRQWLQGNVLDRQLSYWGRQLAGAPTVLDLPTDRPRPPVQRFQGAIQPLVLARPLTEALKELSRRENATLFMALLAGFNVLLYRYTGQDDLLVGSPIANRTHAQLEGLIGCFVNTLVLRTRASGNPSFRELLGRVREMTMAAYTHQDLPFEKLVEELHPQRDLSRNPLFQVLFVLQNAPMPALDVAGLAIRPLDIDRGTAMFDLAVNLSETAAGVKGWIEYSTDLFDTATIVRMAAHFQTLLEGIVNRPDERLSRLPLLTAAERKQLLAWNATQVDYREDRCVHELFEAQAARTPDAIAVVFDATTTDHRPPTTGADSAFSLQPSAFSLQVTYRELSARANQLAHHLRALGVGPEVLVGICVERSIEMVVGLLGILKAGGAYVPLDPAYPAERLAFMLEDSQVPVLLTTNDHRPTTNDEAGPSLVVGRWSVIETVDLVRDWPAIAQQPAHSLESGAAPDNLAYMIYTSGSTGRPKGALNTHGAIRNRLIWMQETYRLTEADRVLQKTPFSFDVSVWEFFWPLMTGARLIVARPGGHQDSAYLVKLIAAQQISTLHFVPSMLQLFLEERDIEACTSLRQVICSGEALPYEVQERFFARLGAALHNLYGPTEAAIDVTFWGCERASNRRVVPIGRPIANTQIYLLDRHMQPVPIGVPGELYIGGMGLARGYHRRPELTAERFIPNPFGTMNDERRTMNEVTLVSSFIVHRSSFGSRLYRTGDLARYLPDGAIEYLGRIDYQVKLRGFRIELEEIETILRQHPVLHDAVVVAREDTPGHKRLVAYIVPTNDQRPTTNEAAPSSLVVGHSSFVGELRAFLGERLPEYMVPAAFVELDHLPLSPNGKLDRRSLPAPDQGRPGLAASLEPPRNDVEARLAAIWANVLGVERVGVEENFFDLGGDSFGAIRAARMFDAGLSVVDLFKYPTIRALAEHIAQGACGESLLIHQLSASSAPDALALVCVPYGGGTPMAYHGLAQALPANYSVYAIALPGHDLSRQNEALQSFEAIAQACVAEILRSIPGPVALYGHCTGVTLTVEIARLLQAAGRKVEALYLGGALPGVRRRILDVDAPIINLLNRVRSDGAIHTYLKKLGGFENTLDPQELRFVLRNFRHDVKQAVGYFSRIYKAKIAEKIDAPIFCIVGTDDPFTKNYPRRYKDWGFFSDLVQLIEIEDGGHYFVQHRAAELARIIVDSSAAAIRYSPDDAAIRRPS